MNNALTVGRKWIENKKVAVEGDGLFRHGTWPLASFAEKAPHIVK